MNEKGRLLQLVGTFISAKKVFDLSKSTEKLEKISAICQAYTPFRLENGIFRIRRLDQNICKKRADSSSASHRRLYHIRQRHRHVYSADYPRKLTN
uniref:Uncharacterized protein n=1 Tax=Romanomermis culicivorax TaxID=13658 RepID=A0A915KR49_ROMCU